MHRFISWFLFRQGLSTIRELIDGYHGHDLVLGAQGKISKRYANEGDLAELMDLFGADALRLAIAWAASPGKQIHWEPRLLNAGCKLLRQLMSLTREIIELENEPRGDQSMRRVLTKNKQEKLAISVNMDTQRVAEFIAAYRPNAAISIIERRLSILSRTVAEISESESPHSDDLACVRSILERVVQMLSPFAPFHCEEAWEMLGGSGFVSTTIWPLPDRMDGFGK